MKKPKFDDHAPFMTDEDEELMDTRLVSTFSAPTGIDMADFAVRTCTCGFHIDGFDEYFLHLKEALNG